MVGLALAVVASVVLPLLATVILDGSSPEGSEVNSLGFGTGGSGCVLTEVASSFPVGVPIRSVLTMEPALSAGDTVAITLEKDGVELVDGRQTITIEEAAPCIYGTLPELEAGRYRMGFDVSSDQMPPIAGEFDVLP